MYLRSVIIIIFMVPSSLSCRMIIIEDILYHYLATYFNALCEIILEIEFDVIIIIADIFRKILSCFVLFISAVVFPWNSPIALIGRYLFSYYLKNITFLSFFPLFLFIIDLYTSLRIKLHVTYSILDIGYNKER